jgi:hypothetical protein
LNQVYNLEPGVRSKLNTLVALLTSNLTAHGMCANTQPAYRDFPDGGLCRSQTEIDKTKRMLGCSIWHQLVEVIAKVSPVM